MKKLILFVASGLTAVMALSSVNVFAAEDQSAPSLAQNAAQMYSTEADYISVDEYITKYGRDNVIEGFNKAETLNEAMLSGNKVDVSATNITVADLTEPNDLFLGF